ncbi:hypothetical protein PVK06_048481 [Gossypium arboreum]|uniref:Uncharacterized protein n=1 Tax=Gossypium arboreum TaxID=29729 RepID=A0ABR0MGJ6_GOSAR|nr:hypothetical protein PVK06_048481 [Gossypium arboreum]
MLSTFLLSKGITNDITKAIRKYWWAKAGTDKETRFSTYGAIVHDHRGMVFAGFTYSIAEAFNAPLIEAFVSSCAVQKAYGFF